MHSETTHFVVVGSGIAGLRAAIHLAARGARVVLLSKDGLRDSNTRWAQGGIAAALDDGDRTDDHLADTLEAGAGLCDPRAVRVMVDEGPARVRELIQWNTGFDRRGSRLSFTREGAHSRSRVLHSGGDATGQELVRALLEHAGRLPSLDLRAGAFAAGVLLRDGACAGVRVIDGREEQRVLARAVLLASGGLGRIFRETSNPPQATGEGLALAWEAGAEIMDLEFVQFHPTVLDLPGAPRFLLSEALRGEGAVLRNGDGERFLVGRHPMAELAPRDVVAREILREIQRGGDRGVYLDLTHLPPEFVRTRFPTIHSTCAEHGLDLTVQPVPVRPAAHYAMGGIRTDLHGRTSVPRLYAAGEAACLGVHGANRLASNSLLDGLVFGARAAEAMEAEPPLPGGGLDPTGPRGYPEDRAAAVAARTARLAADALGALRRSVRLEAAREELLDLASEPASCLPDRPGIEARAGARVAALIAEAALRRHESRGAHYREDAPQRDDRAFLGHSVQQRTGGYRMVAVDQGARS